MLFSCYYRPEQMQVWKRRAAQTGKSFSRWLKDLMDKDAAEVWATIEPEPVPEPELPLPPAIPQCRSCTLRSKVGAKVIVGCQECAKLRGET